MKIHSAKAFLFQHPKKLEESVKIKNSEMKTLPDWVAGTLLFKLALQDGDITVIENREQLVNAENGELNMEEKNKATKAAETKKTTK